MAEAVKRFALRHRLAIVATVATILAILIVFVSPVFQKCVESNQYADGNDSFGEGAWTFVRSLWWCGGVFAKENGEAITGLATVVMAVFTGTLWWSSTQQAKIALKSIELARQEFVSTNRPKLKIRMLKMGQPEIGKGISASFEIVNIGATRATIVSTEVTFTIRRVLDNGRKDMAKTVYVGFADYLAGGEARAVLMPTMIVPDATWGNLSDTGWAGGRIHINGTLTYRDDNGVLRRTGFYRECTADVNRFRYPDFPKATLDDYEYQD